jgi:hypothetical protein
VGRVEDGHARVAELRDGFEYCVSTLGVSIEIKKRLKD